MVMVDANILLYAVNSASKQHPEARAWLDNKLSSVEAVGFAWITLTAFLRISTHAKIMPRPLSAAVAKGKVDAWLGQPNARILQPTGDHWTIFGDLIARAQCSGNLVTDAHLAAVAIEHGATLCTTDLDFARFGGFGLKWKNPIG